MHSMNVMFAYMAPQPFLPMTSVIAFVVGMVLLFGRHSLGVVTLMDPTGDDPADSEDVLIDPLRGLKTSLSDRLSGPRTGATSCGQRRDFTPPMVRTPYPGRLRRLLPGDAPHRGRALGRATARLVRAQLHRTAGRHAPRLLRAMARVGGRAGVTLGRRCRTRYPTAGASEGIHALLALHAAHGGAAIHVFEGEYEGYAHTARALGLEVVTHSRDPERHGRSHRRRRDPGTSSGSRSPRPSTATCGPGSPLPARIGEHAPATRLVVDLTYVGAVPAAPRSTSITPDRRPSSSA